MFPKSLRFDTQSSLQLLSACLPFTNGQVSRKLIGGLIRDRSSMTLTRVFPSPFSSPQERLYLEQGTERVKDEMAPAFSWGVFSSHFLSMDSRESEFLCSQTPWKNSARNGGNSNFWHLGSGLKVHTLSSLLPSLSTINWKS